jgi:Ca2+-transporting ATPase
VLDMPLPLLPLHLLWINLVTDGLPALALVMDPAGADVLSVPPRRTDERMIGPRQWGLLLAIGLLEGAVVLAMFAWSLPRLGESGARTVAFATIVFSELLRAAAFRSERRVFWQTNVLSNLFLVGTIFASVAMQVVLLEWSVTQNLFHLESLGWRGCAQALAAALVPVTLVEVTKLARLAVGSRRA